MKFKKNLKMLRKNNKSFTVSEDKIIKGETLDIYLISKLVLGDYGKKHDNVNQAYSYYQDEEQLGFSFDGRISILSLGGTINFGTGEDNQTRVDIEY